MILSFTSLTGVIDVVSVNSYNFIFCSMDLVTSDMMEVLVGADKSGRMWSDQDETYRLISNLIDGSEIKTNIAKSPGNLDDYPVFYYNNNKYVFLFEIDFIELTAFIMISIAP